MPQFTKVATTSWQTNRPNWSRWRARRLPWFVWTVASMP